MTVTFARVKPWRTVTNSDETNPDDGVMDEAEQAASPHDGLFYLTFSKPQMAAAELKLLLSRELVEMADWESLKLLSNKFVDTKLSSKYSDALFSLPVCGTEVLVYVLFEHKSESDRWTLLQLSEYLTRIWRSYLADEANKGTKFLPIILPVVLHHSARGWTSPKRFREYFDVPESILNAIAPFVLDFGIVLDDISHENSATLLARPMPAEAKLILYCLRYGRQIEVFFEHLPEWSDEIDELRRGHQGGLAAAAMIMYLMTAGKLSEREVRMRFEKTVGVNAAEEVIFAWQRRYDKGFRDGEIEGEQRGEQRGELKGKRHVLQQLLVHRFGVLPHEVSERLQTASAEQLDAMTTRVLTSTTLEEVLGAIPLEAS